MKILLSLVVLVCLVECSFAQQATYDVTAGNGNGIRFWANDAYKIHMGNSSEYSYGPVTGYSIKTNMSSDAGRGWTWGVSGVAPVAALSNAGSMQIAGGFTSGETISITSGIGKGIRLWNQDEYKIHMGNTAEYVYGPVTDYSIKTNMSSHAGRGWTWGVIGLAPVAAINTTGSMQIAGGLKAFGVDSKGVVLNRYGSALSGDSNPYTLYTYDNEAHDLTVYGSGPATLHVRVYDGDLKLGSNATPNTILYNNGNASFGGNVGIGTTSPNEKLTVNGIIYGKEIKIDLNVPGPDYVFEKDYNLPSLDEIENYINQHKHLPEVPSAKEMEANGIKVGEMNMILLKKVEELTLYVIDLKKENENIREEFAKKIGALEAVVADKKSQE